MKANHLGCFQAYLSKIYPNAKFLRDNIIRKNSNQEKGIIAERTERKEKKTEKANSDTQLSPSTTKLQGTD